MLYTPPDGQSLALKLWEGDYAAPAGDSLSVDLAPLPTVYGFTAVTFGHPRLAVDSGWIATSFGTPQAMFYQSAQATGMSVASFGEPSNRISQAVVGQISDPAHFGTPLFPIGTLLGWSATSFGSPVAETIVECLADATISQPTFGGARIVTTGRVGVTLPKTHIGTPKLDAGSSWLATWFGTPRRVTYAGAEGFVNLPLFGAPASSIHHSAQGMGQVVSIGLPNSPHEHICVAQGVSESAFGSPSSSELFGVSAIMPTLTFGGHSHLRRQNVSPIIGTVFSHPSALRTQQATGFRLGVFGHVEKEYVDTFAQRNWDTVVVVTRQHEVVVR